MFLWEIDLPSLTFSLLIHKKGKGKLSHRVPVRFEWDGVYRDPGIKYSSHQGLMTPTILKPMSLEPEIYKKEPDVHLLLSI